MSEEMAVSDNAIGEDANALGSATVVESSEPAAEAPPEQSSEAPPEQQGDTAPAEEDAPQQQQNPPQEPDNQKPLNELDIKQELDPEADTELNAQEHEQVDGIIKEEMDIENTVVDYPEDKKGIKRRASEAFSDEDDVEFKGFGDTKLNIIAADYSQVLERLEAEVSAATKDFTPVRHVMATPSAPVRASKRPRKDTDGSRPSSAQSSRSEGDDNPSASPAHRGRRPTTEMSSPVLRIPLERGWKRELVYRAALDAYSRRNADIYYYTPAGKKLRSTREVAEQLSGTGLTLENFSFFKEPLGVDDPEKEIIRDAKMIRRNESPISSPAPATVEGKRTPKPKQPKGVSPEPITPKSPPAKLKVKSMGSRLSGPPPTTPTPTPKQQKKSAATPTPTPTPTPTQAHTDNNNTAAWKKPRGLIDISAINPPLRVLSLRECSACGGRAPPVPLPASAPAASAPAVSAPPASAPPASAPPASAPSPAEPPPGRVTPPPRAVPALLASPTTPTQSNTAVQPCSLACGTGVPSLSCRACLCLYHPACAGLKHAPLSNTFLCKNCASSSPGSSPPAPTHAAHAGPARRAAPPAAPTPPDKRVLLRMKVSGGSGGQKVWAVSGGGGAGGAGRAAPSPPAGAGKLPQSLVIINGRRFIVVPSEDKRRTRVTNGTPLLVPPPGAPASPRRRGRPRADETDHFTPFCSRAKEANLDVALQIFQYLGMRDLARCARVCKLWRQLASTPALWRHVRMKNSHVSDWGGLCAALKRHGTKWLDLRKMLLPANDAVFWEQFAQHIGTVESVERLELCRCPARAVEAACTALPGLTALAALAVRDASLDPRPLARATRLTELRLKSLAGLALAGDLAPLAALTHLKHLSLTSIKDLGCAACDVVGHLPLLESLELGECTFRAEFGPVLSKLTRLRRLRLERGTAHTPSADILRAVSRLTHLTALELVNVDVKVGFDDALAQCTNLHRLLIIPTYVSQSATTNKQVLSGVLRLKDTLTHLMWGVTIELLRVTELFIDQCSAGGGGGAGAANARRELGECIPVLKPVPGCRLPMDHQLVAGPPQVEILPLPTLQRLLSAQLPNTKLKLLRIPFHATWRQSLADFQ